MLVTFSNMLYLSPYVCMGWSRDLPCAKLNSMIWMVRFGVGIRMVWFKNVLKSRESFCYLYLVKLAI